MKIVGVFYFKRTENGNLIGESKNDGTVRWNVESANRLTDSNDLFAGDFLTVWLEDQKPYAGNLKIKKIGEHYKLLWHCKSQSSVFWGTGKIKNDILTGNYSNTE